MQTIKSACYRCALATYRKRVTSESPNRGFEHHAFTRESEGRPGTTAARNIERTRSSPRHRVTNDPERYGDEQFSDLAGPLGENRGWAQLRAFTSESVLVEGPKQRHYPKTE